MSRWEDNGGSYEPEDPIADDLQYAEARITELESDLERAEGEDDALRTMLDSYEEWGCKMCAEREWTEPTATDWTGPDLEIGARYKRQHGALFAHGEKTAVYIGRNKDGRLCFRLDDGGTSVEALVNRCYERVEG